MKAGQILIDSCEPRNFHRHNLIWPILFKYRHAVEIAMKWIVRMYGRYSYSTANATETEHHNLWELWLLCKQIIIEVGSVDDTLETVEEIIKEFHNMDCSGQAFRYPHSKSKTTFDLPEYPIDLLHIRKIMNGVDLFFTGVDGQLDHLSSAMD